MAALEPKENYSFNRVIITQNEDSQTYNVRINYTDVDDNIRELTAEKVALNSHFIKIVIEEDEKCSGGFRIPISQQTLVLNGEGIIYPNAKNVQFTVTDLTPRKTMTVKEIEKQLGYKIKIKG